jgi:hypothetical protein
MPVSLAWRRTRAVTKFLSSSLRHKLTCLIQRQETLGIVPVFWKDEAKEVLGAPAVLPMAATVI